MKYLKQAGIILLITFLGEALSRLIPFSIPPAIWGLILMFSALMLKIIKVEQIKETAKFLAAILPALFVAPTVGLMDHGKSLLSKLPAVVIIVVLSTVVTFFVSGVLTQLLRRKGREEKRDE